MYTTARLWSTPATTPFTHHSHPAQVDRIKLSINDTKWEELCKEGTQRTSVCEVGGEAGGEVVGEVGMIW